MFWGNTIGLGGALTGVLVRSIHSLLYEICEVVMKLKRLKQWICDTCGGIIEQPEDGWFEWHSDNVTGLHSGFRIVHHRVDCMYDRQTLDQQNKMDASQPLIQLVGSDGLGSLLNIMALPRNIHAYKRVDSDGLLEIIRRLHLPYWEEARLYWRWFP